jgi:DNA-binding HxlR family transcriptional regulator
MKVPFSALKTNPAETAQPAGCPLTATLDAIGGKWNMICLYWLNSGTYRFSELQRLMPEISHKVLTETLRGLEQEGLLTRTDFSEVPPRVVYGISRYGESLRPLIEFVRLWGREHLARGRARGTQGQ